MFIFMFQTSKLTMSETICTDNSSHSMSVKRPAESLPDIPLNNKRLNTGNERINKEGVKRVKCKNHALLLSYCGKNYYGMQTQR